MTIRLLLVLLCLHVHTIALATNRTITDAAQRQVAVPAKPLRVLALSELDLDALLALGVRPAGATRGRGQTGMPAYLGKTAASIPSIGNFASPVPDLALALEPDLILAGGIPDPELLARLATIAPTVVTYRPGEHWQSALRRIAVVMGKPAEGDAVLASYQRRAAQVRTRLKAQQSASVSVVRWQPQGPAYMLRDSFASLVLADLQLRRPASQQAAGPSHSPPLSLEALALIDADWLFVGSLDGAGGKAMQAAAANPAYQRLGAVRRGRVRAVDGAVWTGPGGPLAANAILADVEKAMQP